MVDAGRLLEDLKKLRKKLEADLRSYHAASAGRAAIEAEWREARETKRTSDTFEIFFQAAVDRAAVARCRRPILWRVQPPQVSASAHCARS
jgi:hypothetical protein